MVEFSNLGLLENQSIIKLNVSTIQSVTNNLPNSGALTDIAQVVNQSVVIANQSTILDSFSTDATATNQSASIANQTLISDDVDVTIANTSTLLDNLSSGEIGDATLANQSSILLDGDYSIANQTVIIANQSTILDSMGGDATLANQSLILTDSDTVIINTSSIIQSNSTIDNVVDTIETVTSQLPDGGALTSIGTIINQSSILTDGDTLIANTSTILDNISSGEIGDATLANQSLILIDGDNILSNTSSLIQSNNTIDTVVDGINSVTDLLPDSGALTSIGTLANQSLTLADGDSIIANQTVIVTNTSTILDSLGTDATASNQSIIIANQSTILDTGGGDASAANQSLIIANQSTILDTSGGDATIVNQSMILQYNQTIDNVVDTVQAVTDLLPDSGALTSIGSIANQSTILDNLGSGEATLANQSVIIQYNQTIDSVVDTIDGVTALLPDGGALTSLGTLDNQSFTLTDGDNIIANTTLIIASNSTIDTVVDDIKVITDQLPNSGMLTDLAQVLNQSIIIANQSSILDIVGSDATSANQTSIIDNQTSISDNVDIAIANTSTILDSIGGDATLANQSLILNDGDYASANQTIIIANQSTILDSLGGDATLANQSAILQFNQTIDNNVDSIQSVTDLLPDSGALTSIGSIANQSLILTDGDSILANTTSLITSNSTIDAVVDGIKTVTDVLPDSGALTSIAQVLNQSIIIANQSTILDTGGGDATAVNQSIIIANQSTLLDTSGGDATIANQSVILQFNQTIDNVVDTIQTVTDLLPDSGALTSLAQVVNQSISVANQSVILQNNATIDNVVDDIKIITDALPDSGALTSMGSIANQSLMLIDVDTIILNTSTLLDNISSGEIGDASLANQSLILNDGDYLIANQTIIIANQSTILDTSGGDGTSSNQSGIIANQTLISDDVDLVIANTSSLIQTNSTIDSVVDAIQVVTDAIPDSGAMTSIGSVSNQSLILTDGDNTIVNQSVIIANQSTILDTSGGDATTANQTIIIANTSTILDTLGGGEATIANQSFILIDGDNIIANTSSIIGGNATIDTVVDAIQAVTDLIPDSGAMTSIGSIANQSLMLVDGDNLIANTSSLIQTNATIDNVVDTILTNTSSLLSNTTEVLGNYNLSTASGPHTVFTISVSERKRLASVFLDLYNLSYANNIKIDHKIDGTNYRTIVNTSWAVTDDDGMYFNKNLAFTHDVRLTMSNGTSANATVPYYYILESIE